MTLTGVAAREKSGCALVIVQGQPEAAFCSGEEISPGVRLDTVERDRIVIVRNGAREAVFMKEPEGGAAAGVALPPPPIVQSVGTDRTLVDRRQLQQQLGRPEFLNQALIVPNPDGGFLVRQVQAGSLYEKLGLRPGDVIRNVNGQPLTNMDDVMRLYQQFGTAQRVLVDVQRQGRNETLYYDMR
jgi:general secretion pathway protein C